MLNTLAICIRLSVFNTGGDVICISAFRRRYYEDFCFRCALPLFWRTRRERAVCACWRTQERNDAISELENCDPQKTPKECPNKVYVSISCIFPRTPWGAYHVLFCVGSANISCQILVSWFLEYVEIFPTFPYSVIHVQFSCVCILQKPLSLTPLKGAFIWT